MIRIDDDYIVEVENCYAVKKHKYDENGVPVYEEVGYFGNFKNALMAINNHKCREALSGRDITLDEAVRRLTEAENRTLQAILHIPAPAEVRH